MLGIAFHPDYASNGRFFVDLTNANGDIEVREYHRSGSDPNVADLASEHTIITVPHPTFGNHNGGSVVFGPDGYLYVSIGDGGGGNDPHNNAQNKDVLLGKILRLDVNGDDFPGDPDRNYAIPNSNPFVGHAGADEIWAYGLRNPWRINFDSATGDLYIGDVGQSLREEIDFQPAGDPGGHNYGWDLMEGTLGTPVPGSVLPIFEYGHDKGIAVTGGFVYRGSNASLTGTYFLADYGSARFWTLKVVNGDAIDVTERTDQIVSATGPIGAVSSFGTDGHGNLYIVNLNGNIYRINPTSLAGDVADVLSGGAGNDRVYGGAGDDRLYGDSGNDQLNGGYGKDVLNGGAGVDVMRGGTGGDTYIVDRVNDRVIESSNGGIDRVLSTRTFTLPAGVENLSLSGTANAHGTGNSLDNVLAGNDMDNVLKGEAGNDNLVGQDGNDTLYGGKGNDVSRGGDGRDSFLFDAALSATINVDRIIDFKPIDDTIRLDDAVFHALSHHGTLAVSAFFIGAAAHDADDRIVYNGSTGALLYDSDGTGAHAAVHFATLARGLALTHSDFVVF